MKMTKRILSMLMAVIMILSCWVWIAPEQSIANAADTAAKDHYLFAYFTGNSSDGQTVHLAVSNDGLHYTALRNNDPVIIPSKGTGAVRDPYIWYNEQDNYYYLIGTDMDAADNQWWDNCNGFLMWRSKDLVHWYDETFINVYDMLQNFDEPVGIVHRAWAPQIMWDGESYIVYFSIDTDNVSYPADQLSIVYFRTTDLMDLSKYYEYGGIYYPGSDVNDADIIQHPTNGKWYLFYKPEATTAEPTTKIKMMVSDNATGPYTSADPNTSDGLDIFSTVTEALEGCNGYFDNEGNLVVYADAYGHGSSYFYIAKTSATGDYMTWNVYGEDAHNINSLSPRHGSVVKITEAEYNNLLNNAYGISSSSFPATDELSDHLVGRYFTTANASYNAANGKNDLTTSNIAMYNNYEAHKIGYYAMFDGANSYAKINLNDLVPGGLNYDDGFTITFTALLYGNNDSRIYSITNGSNTTNFASNGSASGAYVVNDGTTHTTTTNLNDGALHDFVVSYANGNIIIYKDGELLLKKNRFNDGIMTEDWYNAISNGTLYIGALAENSGLLYGGLSDFCIYDCSMSYYDVKTIQNETDIAEGLSPGVSSYSSFYSAVPSFTHSSIEQMEIHRGTHFSNVLYSPQITGMLTGTDDDADPDSAAGTAIAAFANNFTGDTHFGVYYPENTVLFVDGVNSAIMPVMLAGRTSKKNYKAYFTGVYPTISQSDTSDNQYMFLMDKWNGWNNESTYHVTIDPANVHDGYVGHNASTYEAGPIHFEANNSDRKISYYASTLKVNENNLQFNSSGYQKIQLCWQVNTYYQKRSTAISGWQDPITENAATPYYSDHNIYVINLVPYKKLCDTIKSEYDAIVKNTSYCPAAIANYKAIVEEIQKFNPHSYDYASNTEAAITACYAQSQKLINDYNTVVNQLGSCKPTTLEARGCVNGGHIGLTEGSYCSICGTVYVEQETYSTLTVKKADSANRKTKATYEQAGEYWYECSDCGGNGSSIAAFADSWWIDERIPYELSYDNLFLFSEWAVSNSSEIGNAKKGSIEVDGVDGTITFRNFNNTSETNPNDLYSAHDFGNGHYNIAVTAGTEYTFQYTTSGGTGDQVHIFYYDANGNPVASTANRGNPFANSYGNGNSTRYIYFTPPEGTTVVSIRFGTTVVSETVTFSNIALYVTSRLEETGVLDWNTRLYRTTVFKDEPFESYQRPSRVGFTLSNMYIDNHRDGLINDLNGANDYTSPVSFFEGKINFDNTYAGNYIMLSEWTENTYSIIFDANGGTGSVASMTDILFTSSVSLNSASTLSRPGFIFLGWSTDASAKTATYADGATVSKLAGHNKTADTITLYAVWSITDDALTVDNIVLDFDKAVTFNPFDNDTALSGKGIDAYYFRGLASEESETGSATFTGIYGNFTADSTTNTVTYTPTEVINGIDTVYYFVSVSEKGQEKVIKGAINIVPASNVLYEEDNFTTTNTTGVAWSTDGTAGTAEQSTPSTNDVYGYDKNIYNTVDTYSNGSALKVTVDSTNRRANIISFDYTGTGFELYSQCGEDTGVMVITVIDKSTGKAVKALVVDTYYNDATYGTLKQVPVASYSSDWGDYTINVSSMYLASAGAVKNAQAQAVMGFGDMVAYSAPLSGAQMLYEALAEVGMEDVFEVDDLEVIWFDDDSIFNGGNGASTYAVTQTSSTTSTTSARTTLTCVVDSVRVYEPVLYTGDDSYISTEQGAQYVNIMDNLVNNGIVSGKGNATYINMYTEGDNNTQVDFATYELKGSKEEIYLANGTNALTFDVLLNSADAKIMVSMRAASGTPVAKFGDDHFTVSSSTEMYYDITDFATITTNEETGDIIATVTIQNTAANSLLAIENIKLTGNVAIMSTFSMMTARRMMMAPSEEVEPNAPEEIPDVETETPDTETDTDVSTEETSEENALTAFISKIIDFFKKIFESLASIFGN